MKMSHRLWRAAAAIMLLSTGGVLAQTAGVTRAKVEAANAAWRRLSQTEVNCVDKALRARNSQIWMLIERGVGPGDASVAAARAGCGGQAPAPSPTARNAPASRAPEPPATSNSTLQAAVHVNAIGSRMPSGYWSFNGSTLNMVAEGNLRKFFYAELGPEAEAVGAQRGDLFLDGKVTDQRIVGTVYGHEGRCGRMPYRVDGTIRDGNRRLDLQGQKPRVDGSCTVVGTVVDALTLTSGAPATAVAAAPRAVKPDVARPDLAKSDVTKPDVAKPVAVRPAIERAAAVMAAADQAAVERADSDDAAEFKTAPDKAPADRPAASRATPVKVVLAAASESKVGGNQAVAEKASAETAVQIAQAEAARAQAQAEQARNEAERAIAEAIVTMASAQSKISFIYGLVSGPAVLGMGALVFWLMRRRRQALPEPSTA